MAKPKSGTSRLPCKAQFAIGIALTAVAWWIHPGLAWVVGIMALGVIAVGPARNPPK